MKGLIDDILAELGYPGLEFAWQEDKATDEAAQQVIVVAYTNAGIISRNEARDVLGRDPDPNPAADRLMVTTGAGLMPLDANTIEGKRANMSAFGTPDGMVPNRQPGNGKGDQEQQATGKLGKRDVSDEPRDDHGRWTSGGDGGRAQGESESDTRERQKAKARERAAASRARTKQRAKEADRAKERENISHPADVAAQSHEEEIEDFKDIIKTTARGAALIAGAALVVELAPEVIAGLSVAKLAYAAHAIGETMLWESAEKTAVHILVKLGFKPPHVDRIVAAFKQHILGKSAGSAGDIQAINALKTHLPVAADLAVDMALDYVAEHAPHASLAAHDAIAEALEDEAEKFKSTLAAMHADDFDGAQKISKAYDPSEPRDAGGRWTAAATSSENKAMDAMAGFTEEEKAKYQLPSEDYAELHETLNEHEEAIASTKDEITRHLQALRSLQSEHDKHLFEAMKTLSGMNEIRADAGLKEISSTIADTAEDLNDRLHEFMEDMKRAKYIKAWFAKADAPENRTFYLIRHGATKLNDDTDASADRIRGWMDVPLAPDGEGQAETLAVDLEDAGIERLYSSDLKRSVQTAEIIGDHLDVGVTTTKTLRPWNLGKFAGRPTKEVHPQICDYARNRPDDPVPQGESFNSFKTRAFGGLTNILSTEGVIGLVTHHRMERLVKAWIANGCPNNFDIDLDTFLQKGEPTGASEEISVVLPTAEKLYKAAGRLAPVPFDRPATRKARAAVVARMTVAMAKAGKKAAAHVHARLRALGKADEKETPEDIANGVDSSDFEEAVPDIGDALAGVAADSAQRTLTQIGVGDIADLVNQVNDRAVRSAHDRAAEMVGMRRLADGTLAPSKNAKNTITETTRDAIRSIIADGLSDNIGSDQIAQNIEDATAFSPERAELIAHTEVGNINSLASLDSAQAAADAGVAVFKGWLTAGDERVEEICRGNEAAGFIPLDDDFPSGDAAPLAHPRCRCTLVYSMASAEGQ
jgi:SPP1 gp7 family putative phage head morphogenesis protein